MCRKDGIQRSEREKKGLERRVVGFDPYPFGDPPEVLYKERGEDVKHKKIDGHTPLIAGHYSVFKQNVQYF